MTTRPVDLRSDTITRPSAAMRRVMAEAEVGDEQRGDDPTVIALCERAAGMLGKEAAVFMPSGTMCNLVALLLHCRPGERAAVHASAHILRAESGGGAAFAGVQFEPVEGERGQFPVDAVRRLVEDEAGRFSPVRLVVVEQTTNRGGGTVWPAAALDDLGRYAAGAGLAVHMDGARLFNAAVAAGVPAERLARAADTVWIDFTKGLGCPLGAVLAGPREAIEKAWTWKRRLGGALRQAGIVAAAALHALDHHVGDLAGDHAAARRLAAALVELPGLSLPFGVPETNLVFVDLLPPAGDPGAVRRALSAEGVLVGWETATRMRLVTHRDLAPGDVERAVAGLRASLGSGTA